MEVFMQNLLISLWMKSALNWTVLLLQNDHVMRSFVGVFCMVMAVTDSVLHLTLTCMFLAEDVQVFQLRFTRYHVCTLNRVVSSMHTNLHWPVFLLAALDAYWNRRWTWTFHMQRTVYIITSFLLYVLAALYVLRGSDCDPDPGGIDLVVFQLCHIGDSFQSLQVAWTSILMVVGVACYTHFPNKSKRAHAEALWDSMSRFLSLWRSFVALLLVIIASGTTVPSCLELNAIWLWYIHSLHFAVALTSCTCIFCAHEQTACFSLSQESKRGLIQTESKDSLIVDDDNVRITLFNAQLAKT